MAPKVLEIPTAWRRQQTTHRRSRAGKSSFARIKTLTRSEFARVFLQPQQEPDKALEEIQIVYDALKTEIERLTQDLAMTRKRLRAERYRTRRLVDMVSKLEQLNNKLEQLNNRSRTPAAVLELGECAEAVAVLLAQNRFKSQNRAH